MRTSKKIIIALSLGIFLAAFIVNISESAARKKDEQKDELFKQVEMFAESLGIIKKEYTEEPDTKKLIYGALQGMLSSLDTHSQFLTPEDYAELKVDTTGKFGGLGIEITMKDGLLTVVTPIDDTPAWKAGIKAGDRIVKIDGEITKDITLSDAVKKLRGEPGSEVALTVLRENTANLLDFKIVRSIIKVEDIKDALILEDGVAYIRLAEFRENTPAELDKTLTNLHKEGMKSVILDLRNNPGGLLDAAVKVAERFLPEGKTIVSTKGRDEAQNSEMVSGSRDSYGIPMIVLVNEGSASGSEIVAGALKDHKRALIVGAKTFGKGSVQTVVPLSDGSALKLTTSLYFTPSGESIHNKGVSPDVAVEQAAREQPAALEEEGVKPGKAEDIFDQIEKGNKEQQDKKTVIDYKLDNQLMRSVDILKAISIYEEKKL
ncbi:MAG: S41 family peptidase [Candidatus Omnitrophica bacterium]|nr:S41 family peptidase [Candidatus Omnitrophota bacterium]